MVTALGGQFDNPKPAKGHMLSEKSGSKYLRTSEKPTAFYHPPKPLLSEEERHEQKIRERKRKSQGRLQKTRPLKKANKKITTTLRRPTLPKGLRWDVLERDGHRCRYCGLGAEDGVVLHVDHKTPRSKGGKDTMENLLTACESCNLGKADKITKWRPK